MKSIIKEKLEEPTPIQINAIKFSNIPKKPNKNEFNEENKKEIKA